MAVIAIGDFVGVAKDTVEHFHGNQLVYVGWDKHLMFYAPMCLCVPPAMRFRDLVAGPVAEVYAAHPQWAQIDWSRAVWLRSGEPFTPDPERSLAENGIGHKESLRLRTPGLDGIGGSGT
ncbi:MAG: phenol hydroxylase subunit P4 [Pseudomonadota bacterium]|nr:phenol hydroxylase subunit P4 [Pseudomonadota bacterium]